MVSDLRCTRLPYTAIPKQYSVIAGNALSAHKAVPGERGQNANRMAILYAIQ